MTLTPGAAPGVPRGTPRFDHAKALRMFDESHSHAEIAQACGVSKAAVSRILVKNGRVTRACMLKRRVG